MVPNSKSRQAVLTSSKLQSAPGTNKKRQFRRNSIFLFNSGRESQAKKTPTAFHKLIWFQRPLGVGTQSDNNPSFRPCPSCQLPSCRDGKGTAATCSFNVAQRQRTLLTPAGWTKGPGQNCRILSKTLKRSRYDRFELCSPFCRVSPDSPSLP